MSVGAEIPDVVAPPPRHPRFPLVDGMRAVAVLCVVTLHVATYDGVGNSIGERLAVHLNLGVTVFFLISGFLLYRPFIAARAGGPPAPRISDYLRRRALRIFPAYWLILTVIVLIPSLTATADGRWIEQYVLIFSLSDSGGWTCPDCVLGQTWSLVVEMTFYAALPIYVLLANWIAKDRPVRSWLPIEVVMLAVLAIASIILQFGIYDGRPTSLIGGSLLSYGLWFTLGMGLAILSVVAPGSLRKTGQWLPRGAPEALWLAALGTYVVLVLVLPGTPFLFDPGVQLLAFVGFALVAMLLLLPAVTASRESGLPGRFLSAPPVAWCGLISYGVFLWHILVIRVLIDSVDSWDFAPLLAATVAISVAIAAFSYYVVERPVLRLKYRQPGSSRAALRSLRRSR